MDATITGVIEQLRDVANRLEEGTLLLREVQHGRNNSPVLGGERSISVHYVDANGPTVTFLKREGILYALQDM